MIIQTNKTLHLLGKNISYVLIENEEGDLLNFYFGKKLPVEDYAARQDLWEEAYPALTNTANLGAYPQEYPAFGHNDTRIPAYQLTNSFGNAITKLRVKDIKIHDRVLRLAQMPSLFGEGDTLEVILADESVGLEVSLSYVVFDDFDVVGNDPIWQAINAIAENTYYEVPVGPYNWMGFPPGVQRLMGMLWMGKVVYPEAADYDMYEETARHFELFYHCELTREQYDALMANSVGKLN